jgi:hypothetical protein
LEEQRRARLRDARVRGADQRSEGSVVKSFLIAIVFLIIGGVAGGFVGLSADTGFGAGARMATGLDAGACSALESTKEQALVTDAQFDEALRGAVAKIAGNVELPPEGGLADMAAKCEDVVAKLQQAAAGE